MSTAFNTAWGIWEINLILYLEGLECLLRDIIAAKGQTHTGLVKYQVTWSEQKTNGFLWCFVKADHHSIALKLLFWKPGMFLFQYICKVNCQVIFRLNQKSFES